MSEKTAVILFNLGGPDSIPAVRPFLRNLFSDPAILRVPQPMRAMLAWLISTRRAPVAAHIYEQMGGKSPIVEMTEDQAKALHKVLGGTEQYKIFTCMRYWHPRSDAVAQEVKKYAPSRIILLPLYPQYSTTTTASSFADWERAAAKAGLQVPTTSVCCYPTENRFIAAHAKLIQEAYWRASNDSAPRILFSAHGLPEKIVKDGDPYCWQVEQTVQAIIDVLGIENVDYSICYQSRVGPVKWVEPSTESEIRRAGEKGKSVVLVPVAFVSEHSETLVELDVEYAALARECGVREYERVPALATTPEYIESLAYLVRKSEGKASCEGAGWRCCPETYRRCGCKGERKTA